MARCPTCDVDRFGLAYTGFWLGIALTVIVTWQMGAWENPRDAYVFLPAPAPVLYIPEQ